MKNSQGGFLSLDFIFALTMVVGFSVVLFALTFTLSVVEVTQYLTFSSARAYHSANFTVADQIRMGSQKFSALLAQPAIKPLFRPGGWFELKVEGAPVGDYNSIFVGKGSESYAGGFSYYGSRVRLIANVMELKFPIIGTTSNTPGAFGANVASYLSREPTETECRENFELRRYQQILALPNGNYKSETDDGSGYVPIMDNGC